MGVAFGGTPWHSRAMDVDPTRNNAYPPAGGYGAPGAVTVEVLPLIAPTRRCRCGAHAVCYAATEQSARGVPVGMAYDHQCARCKRTFRIHSLGSVIFTVLCMLVMGSCGTLVTVHPPGEAVGAQDDNRWFGVGLLVFAGLALLLVVAKIVAHLRYPKV